MMRASKAYYRGCLIGGAVGDALTYPVEGLSKEEIIHRFGPDGIRQPQRSDATGTSLISDATQMTIFTVDGLLWADSRAKKKGLYAYVPCIFYAYQKWFYTQTGRFADRDYEFLLKGEILEREELRAHREPEVATLKALSESIRSKYGTPQNRINANDGCGAVVRAAPVGMYFVNDPEQAFQIGYESGALTHGHPNTYLSAGFFSQMIALILAGETLWDAANQSLLSLKQCKDGDVAYEALHQAISLAGSGEEENQVLASLGEGWSGHEAMARGLFAALRHPEDFERALCLLANQEGNSSGPAIICGHLLGSFLGSLEIPYAWIRDMELSDLMVHGADQLLQGLKEANGQETKR